MSDLPRDRPHATAYGVLAAISASHLLNDSLQSLIPAIYPIVKQGFSLSFAQVGLITLVFQLTASILQPVVGAVTDRRPQPFSLPVGMGFTLVGLVLLSVVGSYGALLVSVAMIGLGSSVFHPESSRVAHLAAGTRRGFAQSFFQVGGNTGSSLGPLLAALVIAGRSRLNGLWFTIIAGIGIMVLIQVGRWYRAHQPAPHSAGGARRTWTAGGLSRERVLLSVGILLVLIFSKYFYIAGITSYFTFYVMSKFGLSVKEAQIHLFIFQLAVAAGTLAGGPIGDRVGRKYVIWASILGAAPFTLLLPHAGLLGTTVLSVCVGLVLSSAFPAILVYAQELLPGSVGLISGLFFGFAFGMGGLGSAALGWLADLTSVAQVYQLMAFLPLLGLVAVFLPNVDSRARALEPVRT
jgi:FSR family fosmidomycin resistance protein-like MFS transporter